MPDATLRHRTYYEGDDDGSVLLTLARAGLLPGDLEVVRREDRKKNPGKDGMLKDMAALINPAGGAGRSAVAIRDVDELSTEQVREWFLRRMAAELHGSNLPIQFHEQPGATKSFCYRVEAPEATHVGHAVVVAAGLPGGFPSQQYEITQNAIDDYVLILSHERSVYDSISEFKDVPYEMALKKLSEIVEIMKANGIPIKHTKRLMHLLRAVTGFRASPAAFAERVIGQSLMVLGPAKVRNVFSPLIESLEEASRLLSPNEPAAPTPK